MIETKQPEVFLFDYPQQAEKNIGLAVSAWASDDFYETAEDMPEDDATKFARKGLKAFHRTAIEYVNLIFVIKNVSRAFQQQLTRTRHASYSIQSMRVVTKDGFASGGRYTMPPSLNENQKRAFHQNMLIIEEMYERMLHEGVSVEDARGILPLNIHSDISLCINLNALYHMLSQRFCVNTQWEYRQVAAQIKEQVADKLGVMFSALMDAPCVKPKKCPMREEYCGVPVWEQNEQERIMTYKKFVSKGVML